ncbi:NAD(P)/FAD-dependent oxidoreductase [Promicromonospora sp. NPDC060204]|uniref:NAD(P)/FAD-dependent oxidoreductase n=1 Tax=Promicromonospora sp. NPDC060204 TaxID=3347071 RepID=UPI00364C6EFB
MGRAAADADVLVVGAGPVGLAAAVHARAAGLDVLVVDHRAGTLDKACGEGLLPGALRAVQALGADPPGHVLTGISYRAPGRHADHEFTAGPGRGVRRTALHEALRARAADVGARRTYGRVTALRQDAAGVEIEVTPGRGGGVDRAGGAGRVGGEASGNGAANGVGGDTARDAAGDTAGDTTADGGAGAPGGPSAAGEPVTLRARWLLGCDGLHSTVRRLAGLDVQPGRRAGSGVVQGAGRDAGRGAGPPARHRYGLRRHFAVAPWTDLVEVHWSPHAEAYVTPVAAGVVGVALLAPRTVTGAGFDTLLRSQFPELAARLAGAEPAGTVLGAGPLRRRSRRRSTGRVRLVGDASGYVDALTGEGVRVGLAQADAAVRHLEDPAAYERAWRTVTRDYRVLTSGLLAWAESPARGAIVPAAARAPWLYGTIVDRLAR